MIKMNTFNSVFKKQTTIGYAAIGSQGTLKIAEILNLLQDAGAEHASEMGVSGFELAKKDLSWVIYRYNINIFKHPAWRETVSIETFRYPLKNLYEIRQFKIKDSHHNTLIDAWGAWVMINRKTRKPVRLNKHMPREMFTDAPGKIASFSSLPKPASIDYEHFFKVRMHDLDLNAHVNNAIYIEWAVETIPEAYISSFKPTGIDVIYQKESLYGDTIRSQTQIKETGNSILSYHSISRETDDAELAVINVNWSPMEENRYDG